MVSDTRKMFIDYFNMYDGAVTKISYISKIGPDVTFTWEVRLLDIDTDENTLEILTQDGEITIDISQCEAKAFKYIETDEVGVKLECDSFTLIICPVY